MKKSILSFPLFFIFLTLFNSKIVNAIEMSWLCSWKGTTFHSSPVVIDLEKNIAGFGYRNKISYRSSKYVMWSNPTSNGMQTYIFNLETGEMFQDFLDVDQKNNETLWRDVNVYKCINRF